MYFDIFVYRPTGETVVRPKVLCASEAPIA